MKRTAIVTGAYGAIGKAITEGIAAEGYRVFMVGRDLQALQKVQAEIISKTGNPDVFIQQVDLASRQNIISFSEQFSGPLHVLVNNAATAPKKRTETPEGIEMQWAVNVLGYFWMIRYFHQFMAFQPDARIVNVASYWAGGLDLRDPEFKTRKYDNDTAYRQAKQANRMLTVAHSAKLKSFEIAVNSCHPGDVNSKISNAFGFGGHETPEEGAATPLLLALSPVVKDISGLYYEQGKPEECQFSGDRTAIMKLFDLCSDQ